MLNIEHVSISPPPDRKVGKDILFLVSYTIRTWGAAVTPNSIPHFQHSAITTGEKNISAAFQHSKKLQFYFKVFLILSISTLDSFTTSIFVPNPTLLTAN